MKCDIAPETLVSLLYNEIEPQEEHKLREHLENCESCQAAFQELCETTEILKKWEDEVPASKTVFIQEPVSRWQSFREGIWNRPHTRLAWGIPVLAAAAVLLLFLFNFQASYQNGNWHIAFGKSAMNASQIDARINTTLAQWQSRQNEQLVQLIKESELRQQQNMTLTLNEYAKQQEQKRNYDLQWVGQNLEGLQRQTEGRYYQTSTLINDLIRQSNMTSPQP